MKGFEDGLAAGRREPLKYKDGYAEGYREGALAETDGARAKYNEYMRGYLKTWRAQRKAKG